MNEFKKFISKCFLFNLVIRHILSINEFNLLGNSKKITIVWSRGTFLGTHISETETLSCYSVCMFFVECVYDMNKNIVEIRSFESGQRLNKYKSNL